MTYFEQKRYDKALPYLQKVVETMPDNEQFKEMLVKANAETASDVPSCADDSPSPGTPGEVSGIGDCPRAGRVRVSSSGYAVWKDYADRPLTPTLSRSTQQIRSMK